MGVPKLIVIRGPSGAGKSTVALRLLEEVPEPIAVVDLDHYRFTVRNQPRESRMEYRLAESAIRVALEQGFHVVFEGNFRLLPDGTMPLPLLDFAATAPSAFYLDVSLPETLLRHATRADRRITEERMIELYPAARVIEALAEVRIAEAVSVEEAVRIIRRASGV